MTALLLFCLTAAGLFTAPPLEYDEPDPEDFPSGIPVLCYHHVGNPPVQYGVSTYRLASDLQALYENGFFLITPRDIENRLMHVPAGRRPVMITFDDGWEDNYRFLPGTEQPDPSSAIGIVQNFLEEHPDFGGGVTFFVSWDKVPFGQDSMEKFHSLMDMGHELGNHSFNHTSFLQLSSEGWKRQVNGALNLFDSSLGLRTGDVRAFAYPGGAIPRGGEVQREMARMTWKGRPSATTAYIVDGMITSFSRVYGNDFGLFAIGRIDMSLYSVHQLLQWRNLMVTGADRSNIRSPLQWRP
jgi:peptidoglycan/xylan/chitin deacetylase (PgdA/CDA1 family)